MSFDTGKLQALLGQSDDALWRTLRMLAANNGLTLSTETPSAEEMKKLRSLLYGAEKIHPSEAKAMLEKFKESRKNHG